MNPAGFLFELNFLHVAEEVIEQRELRLRSARLRDVSNPFEIPASKIIYSCAVLHNLCITHNIEDDLIENIADAENNIQNINDLNNEWYHFLKVLWAKPAVRKFKKSFANVIKNESDENLEQPRKLTTFMRSDSQVFYGTDQNGNSLYIRITLREKRLAESCVQIRLADGSIFQLPEHPLTLFCSIPERKWLAKGLEFTILEPFSSVRISYNGFLRSAIRNNEDEELGSVTHCRFNFIWTAATEANFFPQDVGTHHLADSVSVEPWRNAKWIKLLGFHTGYDQYGSLHGYFHYSTPSTLTPTISPPTTSLTTSTTTPTTSPTNLPHHYTEVRLGLSSLRKRWWGPAETGVMHRMLTLYGADGRGFAFSVGVRSYINGCKELHIGTTMLPNKKIISIEDCDISLPDFSEDGVIIPGVLIFSFKAAGKRYKCSAFPHRESISDMKNNEQNGCFGKLVKINYVINGTDAQGYGVFWYKYSGNGRELPPYIIRPGIQTIEPERKFVASLIHPECRSVYLAGVKGTNLALLTTIQTNKFNTLDGFCILAPALDKHLEQNPQIKEELTKLNDISCGIIKGNLQEACDRIQHLLSTTRLDQDLLDLVYREITLLKFASTTVSTENEVRWCWAVRGAAVHQDNITKPSEMRERTFLDCFTFEDVVRAVMQCWGSVYEYQKVVFRRKRGLPIICDMAVVIQHTLDADTAGDLTTIQPETGNPALMTVSANYGLGVSIVANLVEADTATISRTWDGDLSVSSISIGSKTHRIVIKDNGISKKENNNNNKFCLSKEQVLQLGRAALEIEKALGRAFRIEWAFYKDQLYILNTIPIFPLQNVPTPHELSSPLLSPLDTIIFQNTDNLFTSSESCCTLTSSTSLRYLDQSLQQVYDGREAKRGGYSKVGVVEGVVGNDVFQTILRFVENNITEELKIHEMVTTGQSFITKEINHEALFRNREMKWSNSMVNMARKLMHCWNSEEFSDEASVLSQAINVTSDPETTAIQHFKIIERNLHLLKRIIYLHTVINQCYVFYQKLFLNLVRDEKSEINSTELQNLLDYYSSSNVYQIPSKIELLAAVLRTRHLGDEFSGLEPSTAVPWLQEHAADCVDLLDRIMEEIGCRGVNEFDFLADPWEKNSFALIKIIQLTIQKMEQDSKIEINGEIVDNNSKINKLNGKIIRWLDFRLHNIFDRRSKTFKAVATTINKFRFSYLELGNKLVHEGNLPDQKLIFHLTQKEIKSLVISKRPDLIDRAMKRAILHKTSKPNIPNIYTGAMAATLQQNKQEGTTLEQQEYRIVGSTVVPGCVTGRACVLENIRDIKFLKSGDILVVQSLDPGWIPFFGLISGLVCGTGSIISQGAIAVYKKKIPCVVAQDVTKLFVSGNQIIIGANGVVEKVIS